MRREKKQSTVTVQLDRLQAYHHGRVEGNYAFNGFEKRFARVSDRNVELDANFNRVDGKPNKFFGLEIEQICTTINDDNVLVNILKGIVHKYFPEGFFKYEHDGSLGGESSAEAITLPMTKEGVRNLYPAFRAMYEAMPTLGITANDSSCGMHVNISNAVFGATEKAQEEAVRKLYYIVNRHFELMCSMVSRNRSNTFYCGRMDYGDARTMDLHAFGSCHHVSFNLGHYDEGRIELRLVGGQKDFPCFRNTMETIFHLCDAVKRLSWAQLDDVTAIFSGCNRYVFDRLTRARNEGTIAIHTVEAIRPTVDTAPQYI